MKKYKAIIYDLDEYDSIIKNHQRRNWGRLVF